MNEQRSDVDVAREHEEREKQKADEEREKRERADQEAKDETFGGPEHETSYDEAATEKLGPAEVRHRDDGSVEVAGEEVDDPDEYKGDPIPGGPTDPDAEGVTKDRAQKRKELADEGRDPDDAPEPGEKSHAD